MHVRPAHQSDIHQMMVLAEQSPSAAHWTHADYAQIFPRSKDSHYVRTGLVAEDSKQLVGFLVANVVSNENEWEIENIVVAAEFQRSGVASRLLRELLAIAKAQNALRISLEVRASNVPAIGLYRKLGFVEAGRRKNYYSSPSEDGVILELEPLPRTKSI